MRGALVFDPAQHPELIEQPYTFAAFVLMAISFIVAMFYCLDALYGERRDRSILFWKSLPVSDVTAVLAKASVPILIVPIVTFVITVIAQWIMLLLSSVVMLARGQNAAAVWGHLPLFRMSLMLLFHLLALHGIQFSPVYCWLLLVSAWARRAPLLWAVLPPLTIGVVEKIAFNTRHFADFIGYLVGSGADAVPFTEDKMQMVPLTLIAMGRFLSTPGLWAAIAVAAALLVATIRMRRSRDPI
jgi:ABC-2 type transport system permease protein